MIPRPVETAEAEPMPPLTRRQALAAKYGWQDCPKCEGLVAAYTVARGTVRFCLCGVRTEPHAT